MAKTAARPPVSESSRAAMRDWERAYAEYPRFLSEKPWQQAVDVLEAYPGERVYEVGFGSGANIAWARLQGWEVAGCDVADTALRIARAFLPDADLRKESIVDCTAPSAHYDVVLDRAACSYLTPKDMKRALSQIRRILKQGGVFLFTPYGVGHTKPPPECMPPYTFWSVEDARRLFPNSKWEMLSFDEIVQQLVGDPEGVHEHVLRVVVRKIG